MPARAKENLPSAPAANSRLVLSDLRFLRSREMLSISTAGLRPGSALFTSADTYREDKAHQGEVAQRPALVRQCSLSSTSPQSRWCRSTEAWGPLVDGIHSGEGEGWGREQLGGGHTAAPAEDLA